MFRFFRTLCQRLLSENRFSKYLPYVVGEDIAVLYSYSRCTSG